MRSEGGVKGALVSIPRLSGSDTAMMAPKSTPESWPHQGQTSICEWPQNDGPDDVMSFAGDQCFDATTGCKVLDDRWCEHSILAYGQNRLVAPFNNLRMTD